MPASILITPAVPAAAPGRHVVFAGGHTEAVHRDRVDARFPPRPWRTEVHLGSPDAGFLKLWAGGFGIVARGPTIFTPDWQITSMHSPGRTRVGRMVRFTPNGWSVIPAAPDLLARSSGVGWVRPVIAEAPALETAEATGAADPLHAALHDRA